MYDDKRMYQWDNENALEYAEGKGIEKGIFSVAAKMKNLGYSIQDIADATGLTLEQIEAL